MSDADISAETLNSLGEKVESLTLSETERAALDMLFDRAEAREPEVEGFAATRYVSPRSGVDLSPAGLRLGFSLGFIMQPTHPPPP